MPAVQFKADRLLAVGAMALFVQSSVFASSAQAAVSADEAKQLGTTLTQFGAEPGANADGSIPAYTGGLQSPAGYDPVKSERFIDPFASEKPLYSVSASNMGQYSAVLAPGTKELFSALPDYRIDVYQSHRTMRYTPAVLENTVKNATTVTLAGKVEGDTLTGADKNNLPYQGVPFPIPKSGLEVMWNHMLRFSPAVHQFVGSSNLIDASGMANEPTVGNVHWLHPWYDVKDSMRRDTFDAYFGLTSVVFAPTSQAGAGYLAFFPVDMTEGQKAWFYTPGQRRIRTAPDFSYDMKMTGTVVWEEVGGYVGRMDRFDWKLVGKMDLIVPYNVFGITNTVPTKDFLGKKFINPDVMRWEKHRVWVVDSTRKADASHTFSRRTFYIDEDCWCMVQSEAYDNKGKIVRTNLTNTFPSYAVGGINLVSWTVYDLEQKTYYSFNGGQADKGRVMRDYDTAAGLKLSLTPRAIVGKSVQ